MLLIEAIEDKAVVENFRRVRASKWDAALPQVVAYRKKLLEAQGGKCAYCQQTIRWDQVGHRELDHVLPKAQRPSKPSQFSEAKASSSQRKLRRHTRGYPEFTYIPENIVIACKRCNSRKGSYDGLADRTTKPGTYPSASTAFEWINLHYDVAGKDLKRLAAYLYTAVDGSSKGKAVIHACGLDKPEELCTRDLEAIQFSSAKLVPALFATVVDGSGLTDRDIGFALAKKYPVADASTFEQCVKLLRGAMDSFGRVSEVLKQIELLIWKDAPLQASE